MKSNSKQAKESIQKYIVETVYDDSENNFTTFEEAAKFLLSEFKRVANYDYNLIRFPNNQERFQNYLMGAPFYFPIYHEDFSEIVNSWGINPQNKVYDPEKTIHTFSYLVYREISKFYTN